MRTAMSPPSSRATALCSAATKRLSRRGPSPRSAAPLSSLYLCQCRLQHPGCFQAPPETLRKMEACARALAKSVKYVGAATTEFLYTLDGGGYFFLELNPRLQVLLSRKIRLASWSLES